MKTKVKEPANTNIPRQNDHNKKYSMFALLTIFCKIGQIAARSSEQDIKTVFASRFAPAEPNFKNYWES